MTELSFLQLCIVHIASGKVGPGTSNSTFNVVWKSGMMYVLWNFSQIWSWPFLNQYSCIIAKHTILPLFFFFSPQQIKNKNNVSDYLNTTVQQSLNFTANKAQSRRGRHKNLPSDHFPLDSIQNKYPSIWLLESFHKNLQQSSSGTKSLVKIWWRIYSLMSNSWNWHIIFHLRS